jgi:glycine/D-amino acid oxidase-like deaminating enzyme
VTQPSLTSLWDATAPRPAPTPALQGEAAAHIAIIGAGFTGLSAALHLAEAGQDVAVLDAEAPGWGASGRNGGQVIAGVKDDPDVLAQKFGDAAGTRLAKAVGEGPDLVFSLIERHHIDCAPIRAGWLQPAVSPATIRTIEHRARQWQAHGIATRVLDAAETTRLTGSALYPAALLDPRGGTVQPLSYARGLAAAAATAGARLFGESRALRLTRRENTWRIETPRGALQAGTVILATNAYADTLHNPLRRSVVPIPSFQVATEKLPPDLRATVLPHGHSASDLKRLLRYFRLHDGRLLMGGRGAFATTPPAALIARMRAAIAAVYPAAAALKLDYAWGGMVAVTTDHLPHLHELEPGLHAGLGYNGRGVAMATLMGRMLARRALGQDTDFPTTPLRPIKFHGLSRLGAQATIEYLRLRDRLDP